MYLSGRVVKNQSFPWAINHFFSLLENNKRKIRVVDHKNDGNVTAWFLIYFCTPSNSNSDFYNSIQTRSRKKGFSKLLLLKGQTKCKRLVEAGVRGRMAEMNHRLWWKPWGMEDDEGKRKGVVDACQEHLRSTKISGKA